MTRCVLKYVPYEPFSSTCHHIHYVCVNWCMLVSDGAAYDGVIEKGRVLVGWRWYVRWRRSRSVEDLIYTTGLRLMPGAQQEQISKRLFKSARLMEASERIQAELGAELSPLWISYLRRSRSESSGRSTERHDLCACFRSRLCGYGSRVAALLFFLRIITRTQSVKKCSLHH